jgi:hypothetical protein
VSSVAGETLSPQREWWLRLLAVFTSPRPVFSAMRDDSNDAAQARQEPVLAVVILAGIAGVLSTTLAGRLLDDVGFGSLGVAVWAFLGGALYGFFIYWLGGALLHGGTAALGAKTSYRQVRHVLAYAAAPLAVSLLVVWPVRIALYGEDLFRTGGDDSGTGDALFELLALAFGLWAVALVVIGVRAIHAWSWPRSAAAVVIAAALPALLVVLSLR